MAALVARKSDVSDLRSRSIKRKSGTPDFRAIHVFLSKCPQDVDGLPRSQIHANVALSRSSLRSSVGDVSGLYNKAGLLIAEGCGSHNHLIPHALHARRPSLTAPARAGISIAQREIPRSRALCYGRKSGQTQQNPTERS